MSTSEPTPPPEGDAPRVSTLIVEGESEGQSPEELIEAIHTAAQAEASASEDNVYGQPGPEFDKRAPFFVGMAGALGVAMIVVLAAVVLAAGQVLLLIALSVVLAVGLEPAVNWFMRRGLPRWASVTLVLIIAFGIFGAFLAQAIPLLVDQISHLANSIPTYLKGLRNQHTVLGHLNSQFHIISKLQTFVSKSGSSAIAGGVLGVGKIVMGLIEGIVIVVLLTVYLLADLPRVKRGLYQFAPASRRARVVLLTDAITSRIGGYVLGNLMTSVIAGFGTWVWALIFGIPYAFLLGFMVALLDLVPVVGSTVGGIVVSLIALTVSLPIAIATAVFYFVYRFFEDYLLTPRIMTRTVQVPGLLTVVATVIGGTLLGIIGALLAIPVAATIKLLLEETTFPSLERR